MKQLPENIDEIEKFYQESFDNEFIEPSPLLWEKISTQLPGVASTATAPLVSGVKTFLGLTAKTWLVTAVVSSSMGILGYLYFSDKSFQQKVVVEEKIAPVEQVVSVDSISETTETNSIRSTNDEKYSIEKEKSDNGLNQKTASSKNVLDQPVDAQTTINPSDEGKELILNDVQPVEPKIEKMETMEKLEPKLESSKGIEPSQQKIQSSFFEKKSQQLKDSARPLFVPKGKK